MYGRGSRPGKILAGAVCLFLFGCRHPQQIILITPTTGVPLWDAAHAGAVRGASGCGIHLKYIGPPREDDLKGQLAFFERAVRRRNVGIIVAPIQAQAFRNPVQRAVSSGLPVVVVDTDLGLHAGALTYVLNDEKLGGKMAADKIAQLLKGKGTVAVVGVDVHQSVSLERETAFEQAVAQEYPGIQVVKRVAGSLNLAEDEQIVQEVLHVQEKVDAIVALDATSTRGAYYAMMSEPEHGHVFLVGFDQDLLPPLREGKIAAVIAQRSNEIGRRAAEAVCAHFQEKSFPDRILIPPLLLTPANINDQSVLRELDRDWYDVPQDEGTQ